MAVTIHDLLPDLVERMGSRSETPALDAQVLLAHYLQKPRSWIMAHTEAAISKSELDLVRQATDRVTHGEPLPYVLGHWEFYGLDFLLTPQVLIPRPETELLVERAIKWLRAHPDRRNAIDVGSGSGCIGISLAKSIPGLHVVMTDISTQALQVTEMNAQKHGLASRLRLIQADLLAGITGPLDLICANLPYIPTSTLSELPVARREPRLAMDGGLNGTTYILRLLEQAKAVLLPGGVLLMEIEASQGELVDLAAKKQFASSNVQILKDLSGLDRCVEIERSDLIVHICSVGEWQQAAIAGVFLDASYERNGFIHCSMPEQVVDVANRFYRGIPELVLLWIDPGTLVSEIRWSITDGSIYPHVYGPINLPAVCDVTQLLPERDGIFRTLNLPA